MITLLEKNLNQVIKGKEKEIRLILTAFMAGGHILLEDVPGVGKTTLAKAIAKSIDCTFKRIQFTPDLLPSDILGGAVFNAKENDFIMRKGAIFGNIILADEINRASPRTQSSMLECMSEEQVSIEGVTYPLESPFLVIATQNPIEYDGTFTLPEAQMDRFMANINLGYPEPEAELQMLKDQFKTHPIDDLKPVMTGKQVVETQNKIKEIQIADNINRYIINICQESRKNHDIALGLSPRAALVMMRCSQSAAFFDNRNYVVPDDIKTLAPYVFAHRLILKYQQNNMQEDKKNIVKDLLNAVEVPVT